MERMEPQGIEPDAAQGPPGTADAEDATANAADARGAAARARSLRWFLKAGTEQAHERLDRAMEALDLSLAGHYATFLALHAAALAPCELALEAGGVARLLPDWPARTRRRALALDCAGVGLAAPGTVNVHAPASADEAWGMAYVLEGSRLGGRRLDRRAATSADASVRENRRFLTHGGPRLWPDFVAAMERAAPAPEAALGGALAAFAAYAEALDRIGPPRADR